VTSPTVAAECVEGTVVGGASVGVAFEIAVFREGGLGEQCPCECGRRFAFSDFVGPKTFGPQFGARFNRKQGFGWFAQ